MKPIPIRAALQVSEEAGLDFVVTTMAGGPDE